MENKCCCCNSDCCKYSVTTNVEGYAYTITGNKVTSNASASACSEISYEDAWLKAYNIALNAANEIAKNEANIIILTSLLPMREHPPSDPCQLLEAKW
jgi:hypothetical protein